MQGWPREPTHEELCQTALRWLGGSRRCRVAVTEMAAGSEIVDALGFKPAMLRDPLTPLYDAVVLRKGNAIRGETVLVECKVSLDDLRADRHKPSRRHPEIGVGDERWLLVPESIAEKAVPWLHEGWGLLIAHPRSQQRWGWKALVNWEHRPVLFADRYVWREQAVLISLVQRSGRAAIDNGTAVSIRAYDFEPSGRVAVQVRR